MTDTQTVYVAGYVTRIGDSLDFDWSWHINPHDRDHYYDGLAGDPDIDCAYRVEFEVPVTWGWEQIQDYVTTRIGETENKYIEKLEGPSQPVQVFHHGPEDGVGVHLRVRATNGSDARQKVAVMKNDHPHLHGLFATLHVTEDITIEVFFDPGALAEQMAHIRQDLE